MKLVYVNNDRPITDSLKISDKFKKEHRRVMQDIRELDCSEEFRQHHFVLSSYVSEQNKDLPMYQVDFDGFMFVAMGYTGSIASRLKEEYINEFNRMKNDLTIEQIHKQFNLPKNYAEALRLSADLSDKNEALQLQTAYQEQQLTIQAPKVALYDVAMSADGVQPVGTVAKELGLGRTRLFALLREKKILRNNNEPYQEYIERGYFKLRMYTITHLSNGLENKTQPMVTTKGIAWLHKILKEGA